MMRAALAGFVLGFSVVALLLGVECLVEFGRLGPSRLGFLQRIADVDPAYLAGLSRELFGGLVAIYGVAALACGLALAVTFGVWRCLGLRGRARFALLAAVALLWAFVVGQLRLMAVHPYARNDLLWRTLEPVLRAFWTPGLALVAAAVLGLGAALVVPGLPRRRRLLGAVAFTAFLPLLGPSGIVEFPEPLPAATPAPPDAPPAIVLIGLDSLRPDFIGALAGDTPPPAPTPNLDAFLSEAYVFEQAFTPIGRTHPSWVANLTSMTPDHNGVRYNRPDPWFSERLPKTLAGHLRDLGFRTRFLTDDDLFSTLTAAHGFQRIQQPPSVLRTYAVRGLMDFRVMTLLPQSFTGHFIPDLVANRTLHQSYVPRDFTDRIIEGLREDATSGEPMLLCAHLCTVHYPGTQAGPGYRAYQPTETPPLLGYFKVSIATLQHQDPHTTEHHLDQIRGLYAAGVANVDREVGHLLAEMRRSGLYDRAYVVFWSDHGESFTDSHGAPVLPNHGVYIDNGDQDLRILLAIKPPRGLGPTGRTAALVRSIDLGPTLLDLAGLPPLPGPRDGVSLRPLMEGKPMAPLEHYAETDMKWGRTQTPGEPPYSFQLMQSFMALPETADLVVRRRFHAEVVMGKHRALRRGRWKVAYHPTLFGGLWNLWDVTGAEAGDRKEAHPDVFADLAAGLRAHMVDLEPARLREASGGEHAPLTPPWWPWAEAPPSMAPVMPAPPTFEPE